MIDREINQTHGGTADERPVYAIHVKCQSCGYETVLSPLYRALCRECKEILI